MTTSAEKRSYERHSCKAPVSVSCFNTEYCFETQTLNHCMEGMCIQSNTRFQLGTALLLRVDGHAWVAYSAGTLDELPVIALGEVKWCKGIPEVSPPSYEVGVKYFPPHY